MPQRLRDVWCRELTFLPVLPSPSAAFFVAELPLEEDLTVLFGFLNNGARALNMTPRSVQLSPTSVAMPCSSAHSFGT